MSWKKITGYEDWYEISTDGVIRYTFDKDCPNGVKIRKGKILKGSVIRGKGRYRRVGLTNFDTGERKSHNVHRLVALNFIPHVEGKPCVNHIDGDRENNSVSNLEWCTSSENILHAIENNLRPTPTGEFREDVKYNKEIVLNILDLYYKYQKTYKEIAEEVGLLKGYVPLIVKGKRWVGVYQDYTERDKDFFREYDFLASKRRARNKLVVNQKLKELYNEKLA